MIINLVLFFIPKRQEIYRLYLIKKRKKLACMRLNSNLQAKTKNIPQQESNDIESLINLIISQTRWQNNGIFNICGSWKNHIKGYSAIVQKIVYDQSSIKISGIIFSFDGNGWNFTSHITNDETITKIFFFAMQ